MFLISEFSQYSILIQNLVDWPHSRDAFNCLWKNNCHVKRIYTEPLIRRAAELDAPSDMEH